MKKGKEKALIVITLSLSDFIKFAKPPLVNKLFKTFLISLFLSLKIKKSLLRVFALVDHVLQLKKNYEKKLELEKLIIFP